jgi:hypothetical protein
MMGEVESECEARVKASAEAAEKEIRTYVLGFWGNGAAYSWPFRPPFDTVRPRGISVCNAIIVHPLPLVLFRLSHTNWAFPQTA